MEPARTNRRAVAPTGDGPFTPIPLFAFPLYSTIVAGFDAHRGPLLAEILEHQASHAGITRSNYGGWHSGEAFAALKSEQVAWLLRTATQFARLALAPTYGEWRSSELRLGTWWANVLGQHGWNAPHHHAPQHWSGVFYVEVGGTGTTTEDLGGMIEFLNPYAQHVASGLAGNFVYGPKNGLILLFPSSLVHFVHPYRGEEPRVSIAFNFNVVARPPGTP
jgi:uncharacterized protein (TIGR02466 family)